MCKHLSGSGETKGTVMPSVFPTPNKERWNNFMRPPGFANYILGTALAVGMASSAVQAQPFSVVLLPDTQYYTTQTSFNLYNQQMTWINNNKNTYNIKFVIHLGDMTNNNTTAQWTTATNAYNILNNSGVPYSVLPGNHDYLGTTGVANQRVAFRDLANFNANFGPQKFTSKAWYGGNKGNTTTNNENNYCFFEVGTLKFMVLSLEYAPRKETITWANNLISQNPDRRVIIGTHGYLTTNGAYITNAASQTYGIVGAGGSHLYDELVRRHSNVFLAVCGHVTESEVNVRTGVPGNTIYEMLVDYQGEKPRNTGSNLGNGWLRVLEFDPATDTIDAWTVSVAAGNTNVFIGGTAQFYETSQYNASYTHSDHLFSLPYDMGPLPTYSYLNASTEIVDFTVNSTGGGNQYDAEIAQDANGNFVAVWESDHDNNGIFDVRVRGFDSDGNHRFSETIVNTANVNATTATNPSVAMAADGRFVVAFQRASTDIRARVFAANGTPSGTEFVVPSTTGGTKRDPDVGMADNGDFIIAWEDDADANGSYQIRARGFLYTKAQKFAEKTINAVADGQQYNPKVAVAPNGDYVVAWMDDQNNDALYEIGVRGYLANETQRFAQFFANATTAGQQADGDVAIDPTGRFAVVWEDDNDGNGSYQVRGRGFNANGTQLWSERTINSVATGNQLNPSAAMDSQGNAYFAWQDTAYGEGNQMLVQTLNTAGTKLYTTDLQANLASDVANDAGAEMRRYPAISVHKNGRILVGWEDDQDGNGAFQILARGATGQARKLVTRAKNGTVSRSVTEAFYRNNQSVTVTATPSANYSFDRWIGDVPSGSQFTNPLALSMSQTRVVEAVFVLTNPPPVTEVIVDNASSGFTASSNWTTGSFGSSYYGSNYHWRSTQAISDTANWNVNLPVAGSYHVYARWPAGSNRSTTAPFLIYHTGGTANVPVNQQGSDGQWVHLGTYNFNAGASNKVGLSCWTTAGFVVVADAVKFELNQ